MTFWTIMIVTILSGPLEGSETYIPYQSMEDCMNATRLVSESFNWAFDHKLQCEETSTPSSSLRPKQNPIYEDQQ